MQWLFEQVAKEMKSHPVTLVLVIGGIIAIGLGYSLFATAGEVEQLKVNQEKESKIGTCRWLSDKIDDLRVDIFNLEKDGADAAWVNEKKSDLQDKEDRYKQTTCSTIVY